MNETAVNTTVEPAYIARLALKALPFRQQAEPEFFFYGEQIEQRLNLLSHLVRVSEKVVFVFADAGVGKTSMLKQLQHTAGSALRICYIEMQADMTPSQLLSVCLQCFGAQAQMRIEQQQQSLQQRLQRLRKLNIRPVLLIDNIDRVTTDSEVAKVIFDLFSWQDEDGFLLQGVLTACTIIAAWDQLHGRLQRMDLPELAANEIEPYLMHRLRVAGYQGERVFSDKQIRQIYHQSAGCPARVNQLAHAVLLGLPATLRQNTAQAVSVSRLFKWIAMSMVAVLLLLLLIYQDKINAFFSPATSQPQNTVQALETAPDDIVTQAVVAKSGKADVSAKVDGREELVQLVTELTQTQAAADKTYPDRKGTADKNNNQTAQILGDKPISQRPDLHGESWIMQQDSHDYTFQLMGSWQREEVLAFIDKYALTGDLAMFESMRNGRRWYALLYGVYADKAQALAASRQWPAPLNTLPSWLRRFDSVQNQIRNKAIKP